ncbi:efflux RND transporter periplasmic adaptor subunit [Limnohabitans sp. Rim28]|uniref:efflux RND transporter periplasmic adaptor subunit n=1 Tax=Limnohabitans sp. Rim28 TaxID=1100720 RepID=UPI0002F6BEBB|nr:efflux RND transporter periplasmic adaptor subunit [Limnohabitans sp. Rim28]PVE08063.1 efflux transporter periplasmic adaptor subunit [Limnohabitans sp. Rim28]
MPLHVKSLVGTRVFLLSTVLSAFVLTGCGKPSVPVAAEAAKPAGDPLQIQVEPSMASRFKVADAAMSNIVPIQEVPGRIEANERQVTRIGASVTGRVTELLVEVGDRIKAGQPLARVASPELTQAQMAFLRAHSNAGLAERAVDRARQLFQADVIGAAELQRRESELSVARAEMRALSDQLKLLGIAGAPLEALRDQGALQSHAPILATQSGVLLERKISNGQVVQPGDHLFTVADLGNVWVSGALPEQTARSVRMGQQVDIEVPALGNRQLSGRIIYVGDAVSPETRTVPFRTQVDNLSRDLKPQMLATMRIRGEATSELVVPQDAVIRESDRDHVYLKVGEGTFRFTPVELAPAHDELRPVRKGVKLGDPVVVQGAFHLHNERKRAELQ